MNIRRFFIDYLLVPVGMPVAAAILAGYHVSQEVDPSAYATLSAAWPHLHQPTRDAIATAMRSNGGAISRWAYVNLFDEAMGDANGIVLESGSGSVDVERSR